MQDNAKQLVVAMDKHYQEWAKLMTEADKNKTPRPEMPDFSQMSEVAYQLIQEYGPANNAAINQRLDGMAGKLAEVEKGQGVAEVAAGQANGAQTMQPF